ncbi:MAG TPA: hypothetical protein PLV05_14885, partial [Verrucomicrobiota bacterium]|nr:hypothetical protein [Verrucomicrobiota bacterium]
FSSRGGCPPAPGDLPGSVEPQFSGCGRLKIDGGNGPKEGQAAWRKDHRSPEVEMRPRQRVQKRKSKPARRICGLAAAEEPQQNCREHPRLAALQTQGAERTARIKPLPKAV